ncbi:DUF6624 domain-containing protein [Saccharicrinis sp. FJH62]|uniref:DUF6624 domain-containing protein n=1 Tax=Saccharicrinis sp. FJH62 TaxID=3344657 RepID=UPI0035D4F5E4
MKKLTVLTILSLFVFNYTFGQDSEKYSELIKTALNLYESKDFLKSGEKYSEAFVALGGKGMLYDRYNAACSWALANKPDSAFVQLFKIAHNGNYTDYGHITTDTDLNSLHNDERWTKVIEIVKTNKEKTEANLDKPLVAILDTIYQEDQKYRQQIEGIEEKYGWESDEMKVHWKTINEKDSINLSKVKKILDERGWLGPDVIGNQGNATLFLVIQHSDIETQEKYLPMMREAVSKGNARASSLALLEDRVALRKGKKQIYGSQIGRDQETGEYYVLPLIDPDNVDKRRAEVELETIQEYISNWGMTWDIEEYKKKLPEIEAKRKQ